MPVIVEPNDGAHSVDLRLFSCILAAFALLYTIAYLASSDLPGNDPGSPYGWWAWFDQGEYLKSARALAAGHFKPEQHTYPPLYALMAAPFVKLLPAHPFFPFDLFGFLAFVGVLLWIGGRIYGLAVAVLAILIVFIVAPYPSLRQWVVPWTTTMSAYLISVQIAVTWYLSRPSKAWGLRNRWDWVAVACFFVSLSGLAATRPLDFVALLPLSIFVFVRLQLTMWRAAPPATRPSRALRLLIFCAVWCALCAALLIGFNLRVYHHVTSDYIWNTQGNGYFIADIPEKAYSILLNSAAVYAEAHDALFERAPIFAAIFALALVALFTARPILRWILLTGLFQIALYLPYGDLMPTALYRFGEIHYFKWILMWFAVIALGEAVTWLSQPLPFRARVGRAAALALLLLLFTSVALVPGQIVLASSRRDAAAHTLDLTAPDARQIAYVDIPAVGGGFQPIYFGSNSVSVNGEPLAEVRDFRLIPTADGARLVFIRPQRIDTLHIGFDPQVTLGPDTAPLALTPVRLAFRPLRAGSP